MCGGIIMAVTTSQCLLMVDNISTVDWSTIDQYRHRRLGRGAVGDFNLQMLARHCNSIVRLPGHVRPFTANKSDSCKFINHSLNIMWKYTPVTVIEKYNCNCICI